MPTELIGLAALGVMLVLIFSGVPIAFSLISAAFFGVWWLNGIDAAMGYLRISPFSTCTYAMTCMPFFMLMGNLAFACGLATRAFDVAKKWLGHIPGGLPMAVVMACAAFGSISGSSGAAAAVMAKMTIPEMEKAKIDRALAAGVVACAGTFASMIPPSMWMIIYSIIAETPTGPQLMAGWLPGLLTAGGYAVYLYLRVKVQPSLGGVSFERVSWGDRITSLPSLWPLLVLAGSVTGGIYSGLFTPTEAAAIACAVALALFMTTKALSNKWGRFKETLLDTGRVTAMAFCTVIGGTLFARMLAPSRLTFAITDWLAASQMDPYLVIVCIAALYLVMGCFMEPIGMMMITIPILAPVIGKLGFSLIWFGIIVTKMMEVAAITPPVGITIYIVKSVCPHIEMSEIFRGIWPFILVEFCVLAILIAFPAISTYIPDLMGAK